MRGSERPLFCRNGVDFPSLSLKPSPVFKERLSPTLTVGDVLTYVQNFPFKGNLKVRTACLSTHVLSVPDRLFQGGVFYGKKAVLTLTDLNDFQLSVDLLKILFPDVFCGEEIDFVKLRSKLVPLLHKNGELPALNWNEKNSLKKAPFSGVRFHPLSNGAAPFGERNAFICGQPLKALQLLQKTHNGKIRLAIVDVPSPSEQSLKKTPAALTRCLNSVHPVLCAVKPLLHQNACIFLFANNVLSPYVKVLCDEIFGMNAFYTSFVWQKKSTARNIVKEPVNTLTQNILCYQNGRNILAGESIGQTKNKYPFHDETGRFRLKNIEKKNNGIYERRTMGFPISGRFPPQGKRWCFGQKSAEELEKKGRFVLIGETVKQKVYDFEERPRKNPLSNLLFDQGTLTDGAKELNALTGVSFARTSKPVKLFKTLIRYVTNEENIVLDVFAGTGGCAQAVLELNAENSGKRRFIGIQKPESSLTKGFKTVCDVARTRLLKVQENLNVSDKDAVDFFTLEQK